MAAVGGEAGEAGGVNGVIGHLQRVAGGARDDGAGDQPAEVRDVPLNRLAGGVGRCGAPQRVNDPVDRDHASALHQQQREQRPLPPGGDAHVGAVLVENPHGTKDLEVHARAPLPAPDRS